MAGREGKCRECSAAMIWATMESGKSNPLDPDPIPVEDVQAQKGQIAYVEQSGNGRPVTGASAAQIREWVREGRCTVHKSHWATCPERAAVRARVDAERRGES